jgi:hypothetical protein
MKCALRIFAVIAAWTLAAGASHGAEAGPSNEKSAKPAGEARPNEAKATTDASRPRADAARAHAPHSAPRPDAETSSTAKREGGSGTPPRRSAATKGPRGDAAPASHDTKANSTHSARSTPAASNSDVLAPVVAPIVPVRPTSRGSTGVIDKKTARAIGLVRPHEPSKGGFAASNAKNRLTTSPSSVSPTATALPRAGFASAKANGGSMSSIVSASSIAHRDTAMKAVAPSAAGVRPASMAAVSIKRTAAVAGGIGGATAVKTAAVINGTAIHIKPH